MRVFTLLSLTALGAAGPAVLLAQDSAATPRPIPVVDHTFSLTAGERQRIFLAGGATYHAEVEGTSIRLRLRPVDPGVQSPLIQPFLPGRGASGTSIYLLKPRADAEYFLETIGGAAGRPVRVRIVRQADPKSD